MNKYLEKIAATLKESVSNTNENAISPGKKTLLGLGASFGISIPSQLDAIHMLRDTSNQDVSAKTRDVRHIVRHMARDNNLKKSDFELNHASIGRHLKGRANLLGLGANQPSYIHKNTPRVNNAKGILNTGGSSNAHVIAHEAGHAVDFTKSKFGTRRIADQASKASMVFGGPAYMIAGYHSGRKGNDGKGAMATQAVMSLPMIRSEMAANHYAAKSLKKHYGSEAVKAFRNTVRPGFNSYLGATGSRLAMTYAATQLGKHMKNRADSKKAKND